MSQEVSLLLWAALVLSLIIWLVFVPLGLQGIFAALGVDRSRAWVPFVNIATVYRLGGHSEFWLVALVVPGADVPGLVMLFVSSHRINRRLGRSGWYTVLAVVAWWVWTLALGLQSRVDRSGSDEPLVWSVQQPPRTTIALPNDEDPVEQPFAPRSAVRHAASPAESRVAAYLPSLAEPEPVPRGSWAEPDAPFARRPAVGSAPAGVPAPSIDPAPPAVPVSRPSPPLFAQPAEPPLASPPRSAAPPAGAPVAAPRAVAAPLSAPPQQARTSRGVVTDDDEDDETIIAASRLEPNPDATIVSPRRRPRWWLETSMGARIELTGTAAIVGRRPAAHPLYPGAQLIAVTDEAHSVSSTHAVLEYVDGDWQVTDLGSTNGVWLVDPRTGAEAEVGSRNRSPVTPEFMLGELAVKVVNGA